jgi:hypothetical protein
MTVCGGVNVLWQFRIGVLMWAESELSVAGVIAEVMGIVLTTFVTAHDLLFT